MNKLKLFAVILYLFPLGLATMIAQTSTVVRLNLLDGTQKSIDLASIGKINFANSSLVFNFFSGSIDSYPLSKVQSLVFNGLSSGIEKLVANRPISVYPSLASQSVSLRNLPDGETKVTIFRQDGLAVITTTVSSAAEPINIAHLARGFYFICVNNQVLKFIKR